MDTETGNFDSDDYFSGKIGIFAGLPIKSIMATHF